MKTKQNKKLKHIRLFESYIQGDNSTIFCRFLPDDFSGSPKAEISEDPIEIPTDEQSYSTYKQASHSSAANSDARDDYSKRSLYDQYQNYGIYNKLYIIYGNSGVENAVEKCSEEASILAGDSLIGGESYLKYMGKLHNVSTGRNGYREYIEKTKGKSSADKLDKYESWPVSNGGQHIENNFIDSLKSDPSVELICVISEQSIDIFSNNGNQDVFEAFNKIGENNILQIYQDNQFKNPKISDQFEEYFKGKGISK